MSSEVPKISIQDPAGEEPEKTAEPVIGFKYLEERLLRNAILRAHEKILEENV